jgi:predicted RNase H-like HicB family nuclease
LGKVTKKRAKRKIKTQFIFIPFANSKFCTIFALLKRKFMEKIIMIIEKSKDFYDAYSDNCDGIYAAGDSIEAVKADAMEAVSLIKKNLPDDRWPKQIKGEFEIEWKFDVPSFLEYYGEYLSLAGLERMTGIHQKQLSNYLHRRSVPRQKQADRIINGLHRFAREILSITL